MGSTGIREVRTSLKGFYRLHARRRAKHSQNGLSSGVAIPLNEGADTSCATGGAAVVESLPFAPPFVLEVGGQCMPLYVR